MDNLTHSFVAIAVAESFYQRLPASKGINHTKIRATFWVASVLSNNLPDIDALYAGFQLGGKLGYLLHHRGHTHTLPLLLVEGWLMGWLVLRWLQTRVKNLSPQTERSLKIVCLLGPILHVSLDGLNSYGIHPFWPVWNGWWFGDSVFIVEPLLWACLIPVIYFASNRRMVRWACEVFGVAVFSAAWLLPLIRWYSTWLLFFLTCFTVYACRKLSVRRRADFGLGCSLAVLLIFVLCSVVAKSRITTQNQTLYPTSELLDVVVSPLPANPACWAVLTIETFAQKSRYRVRKGVYSLFPSIIPPKQCPVFSRGSTAYLTPVTHDWGKEYLWEGQYTAALDDLNSYRDYSCQWRAFLEFARAPFLQEEEGSLWAGDLRFDLAPKLEFSEFEVSSDSPPCSGWVPGWKLPRSDIFQ